MKTTFMDISERPTDHELRSILGQGLFTYYTLLRTAIIKQLSPEKEIWDLGGRRGKYFNGYIVPRKRVQINLFIISKEKEGMLKCEIVMPRILFKRIYSKKANFQSSVLNSIDTCKNYSEEFGGAIYLSIIIDSSTAEDTIKIIDLL